MHGKTFNRVTKLSKNLLKNKLRRTKLPGLSIVGVTTMVLVTWL